MEFKNEEIHKDFLQKKKKALAVEAKSEKFNLTNSGRFVLPHYFGYQDYFGFFKNRNLKKKEDASIFIQKSLWSNTDETMENNANEEQTEKKLFGLFVPRLFSNGKNGFDYFQEKWFLTGFSLSDTEQISVVRSFQSLDRIFDYDVTFNRNSVATKILMCGQGKESERERERE